MSASVQDPVPAAMPTTVQVGDMRVGFTIGMGEWKPAKNAKSPDGRKAAVLVNWTKDEQPYALEREGFMASGSLASLSWKLENLQ